jgi:hypothetical protein
MAGEESTVGGVTVQQYLAEVERTITDPTYKHLRAFQGGC